MKKILASLIATVAVLSSCSAPVDTSNLDVYAKGNLESEIVLQEFADFQCPACRAASSVVGEVVKEFEDDIRFEFRHFPLNIHNHAKTAAYAAEAAGKQGKFWEMEQLLYANQPTWAEMNSVKEEFATYAETLGLDVEQFKADMDSSDVKAAVQRDLNLARELNLSSTPSFLLNGQLVRPRSFEDLKVIIREGLANRE